MALSVANIRFDEYRGYSRLELADLGRLVVFAGPNAVGKTNIIEGLQLLTAAESFRKPVWPQLVSWDAQAACIRAQLVDMQGKRDILHKMTVADGRRSYEVNGKRKPASAVRGTCPSVLFIPDHLQLVKASSSLRRDMVDALGCQLSSNYQALKADYQAALKQRNLLIKNEVHDGALFESWDESCAIHGARLTVNRLRLFERLAQAAREVYAQLADGELLECVYVPSWSRFDDQGRQRADAASAAELRGWCDDASELDVDACADAILEASKRLALQELSRKTSLVGPHKDEIAFFIGGRNARLFASQGQQRTVVLAEKLAEVEIVRQIGGTAPVLLLDDVMSELDAHRRDALTQFIDRSTQAFVTTTNLGYFSAELLGQAQVVELPIEGTRRSY